MGEYTAKHGGTVEGALSAITTTLSRVNQVLERDLGIHLNLVENNDLLINVDAASDPFTETELTKLVFQNQEYLDAVIGSENYDIGHLFSAGGGGIAAIASVCNGFRKAQGMSGISNPVSDSFDLDFVEFPELQGYLCKRVVAELLDDYTLDILKHSVIEFKESP